MRAEKAVQFVHLLYDLQNILKFPLFFLGVSKASNNRDNFNFKWYFLAIFIYYWYTSFMLVFHLKSTPNHNEWELLLNRCYSFHAILMHREKVCRGGSPYPVRNEYAKLLHNTALPIAQTVPSKTVGNKYYYVFCITKHNSLLFLCHQELW